MKLSSLMRVVLLVVVSASMAGAQEQPPSLALQAAAADTYSDDSDGPEVTNRTHGVDVGLLQIEVGGLYSRSNAQSRDVATPTTFRLGLTDWLEVHVGSDGLLDATALQAHERGFGNTQIGAKLQLWEEDGGIPVLSILPTINLPTASAEKGLGSGESDFTMALLTGTDVLTRGHLDFTYGIGRIGAGPGLSRFTQHFVSLSASVEVPGPLTPSAEVLWMSRQEAEGGRIAEINAGAVYTISTRYAFDGGVQAGLTKEAPSLAVFGGLSVIVGNILGDHGVRARQPQALRRHAPRQPKRKR